MTNSTEKITREEILEYADRHGYDRAADLLILGGPDWIEGDYNELLKELEYYHKQIMEDVDYSILCNAK